MTDEAQTPDEPLGSITKEALKANHEVRMDLLLQRANDALGKQNHQLAAFYGAQIESLQNTLRAFEIEFEPRVPETETPGG